MATLSITCGGSSVNFHQAEGVLISDYVSARSTCTFTVIGSVAAQLSQGMDVEVTDSVRGLIFGGTIDTMILTRIDFNNEYFWQVTCKDRHYLADKRLYLGAELSGFLAGDAVAVMHQQVLAAEGVTAAYALDLDDDAADFATGTLSHVDGSSGVLQLASAGVPVTHTDTTTANFTAAGTSATNINTANNQLALASYPGLMLTGTGNSGYGAGIFASMQIWSGSYTIQSTDELVYSLWINKTSPAISASVEGVCS